MKTLKRIRWGNVIFVLFLAAIVVLYSAGLIGIGKRDGIEKLKYSQQEEARLHAEVKMLDIDNDKLRSDIFRLRFDLSNAQDDIEELQAQLDNK